MVKVVDSQYWTIWPISLGLSSPGWWSHVAKEMKIDEDGRHVTNVRTGYSASGRLGRR